MKLEYGIPTDKIGTEVRFGITKGFFRDEGIDLSVRVIFGGPEIAAMYDSGELKVGEIGSPPATTAIANGARFKIVGSGVRRRALQYLVVDSTINSWNDLKGKNIGVLSKGSCSYWFARLLLEMNGLDPDNDAEVIGMGSQYADVVDRFESGDLHAAVISELNVSIGEYRNAFRIMKALTEPEFCPTMQWMVMVANDGFIEREASLLSAVMRACLRSYHYSAANPEEFAEFGATFYGVDKSTILRSIERERDDVHYDCEVDMPGLDLAIDLQRRLGAIHSDIGAGDMTDLRFLPGDVGHDVAERNTMFIYNSWYVAAWSNEIELGGKPFSRTILGEPIVMYRTSDGSPAALEGRCAHRRMSLVNGKVVGDNLVCCYHGLTYDASGRCVRIPGQTTKPPASLRVRGYPAVERYGAVWLWMGDPALADPKQIFNCAPIEESAGENSAQYYWHIKANYLYLNDNLSDLLHQAYLHNPSFGGNADPLGETRPTLTQNGDRIQINWDWSGVPVPLTYGELGGISGLADGWNHSEYTPPCFYVNYFGFAQAGTGGIETPRKQGAGKFLVSFYQLITPETERTTHFFKLVHCEMPEMLPRLAPTVEAVNAEDNWACEEQQKMEDVNPQAPRHAIATDAGVIAMRRVVERLYLQEQQTQKLQPT